MTMYIRKSTVIGVAVFAAAMGWLGNTIAQEQSASPVATYFDHEKVDAAFAKGGVPIRVGGQFRRSVGCARRLADRWIPSGGMGARIRTVRRAGHSRDARAGADS